MSILPSRAVAPHFGQPAVYVSAASRRRGETVAVNSSRESEIFVICVYLFGSDWPPRSPAASVSRYFCTDPLPDLMSAFLRKTPPP